MSIERENLNIVKYEICNEMVDKQKDEEGYNTLQIFNAHLLFISHNKYSTYSIFLFHDE